ncbi:Glutathione S-transferase [Oryctes borbonicus]|uniref:glutathione transferase n=1 Tax=Oryctes borbonicus TaxID=1629725 RepID=A0A0T6B3L6_9SCAR|nr:Glutathione S-transferase [Oryctes borbonicus]
MSIKLTYFDLRGRAEVIRYLLKYGGIEFQDVRITIVPWGNLKSTVPFGQLPIYEEHGKVSNQTIAITRYLAKKIKLAGNNNWEDLELDALVDTTSDLLEKVVNFYHERDTERREQLKRMVLAETIPFYLSRFEAIAEKNFGFLAFGRLTWADFFFTTTIDMLDAMTGMNVLKNYPHLQGVVSNVTDLAVIKEWREKDKSSVVLANDAK